MRNKNFEMQELNDAAELLAQVEGATLSPADLEPIYAYDPVRPIILPPFQMMYGIWIPPKDWFQI